MRVAVGDRLEALEPTLVLEVFDDRLGDIAHVPAGQRPEAGDDDAGLVERRHDRQAERLAELVVLGATARRDVDDAGALVLADLVPGDDDVLVRLGRASSRVPAANALRDGRQLVEWSLVAPADELMAEPLLDDLERTLERRLQRATRQPVAILALLTRT